MPKHINLIKLGIKNFFFNFILKYDRKNILSKIFLKKNFFQRGLAKYSLKSQDLQNDIFLSNCLNLPGKEFVTLNKEPSKNFVNKLNSVAGYIPFEQGKTQVSLYNFFSKNYSIRKQLLGGIYFLKNGLIVNIEWFLLPADCIKLLDLSNKKIDADTIIVEYFHDRISKNHAHHSGHLRFHGIYDNYAAIVHSMPIDNYYFKYQKNISTRRFFPKNTKNHNISYDIGISNFFNGKKIFNINKDDLYGDYSKKIEPYLSFNIIYSKLGNDHTEIRSVFHDSALTNLDHKPTFNFQLIDIPSIKGINAILYFTETFLTNSSVSIRLYFFNYDEKITYTTEAKVDKNSEISLQDFVDLILIKFVIVEILDENITNQYINIYYSLNNKICDNVHAHCLEDERCLPDKRFKINLGSQALKWMHFPEQELYNSYMSIINTQFELDFKLRIIFNDYDEFIILKNEIPGIKNIGKIDIDFKKLLIKKNLPINKKGIVQLECRNANPNANLFSFNELKSTLCVDHFTGG
jgi:hypothetical protein